MQYRFLHVHDDELLERIYRFRHQVWCEEFNYIPHKEDKREVDEYDQYCDQFAVLDSTDEICATMRLIHHSPIGYPTEHFLKLDDETKIYRREKLGELSRILIGAKHRNMKETKIFISSLVKSIAYLKMKEYGIEYCYGSLEDKFLRLVNMFKVPYVPISQASEYNGAHRYPAILYTTALEFENPQLLKQWKKHIKPKITA